MPAVDGNLAGDHGGAAPVAVLDDLQEVVTLLGIERLQTPVVEDEELDAAEPRIEAGIATVARAEREIANSLGMRW